MTSCRLILLSTLLSSGSLFALPTLGPAAPFNVFVFNSFNETNADTGGRIAIGTNATFNSNFYAVSQFLNTTRDPYPATYNLVIAGTITLNPSTNNKVNLITGNAWTSITGDCAKVQTAGGGTCSSSLPAPIDFAAANSYFNTLSNYYTTMPGSTVTGAGLTFAASVRGLNVFNVSATALKNATSIAITGDATQDTIVINVTGTDTAIPLPNIGITFNGQAGNGESSPAGFQRVIWNFPTPTSLTGASWAGTMLAPKAAVSMSNGQIIGQLISSSFSGGSEFHDYVFTGTAPIPEPGTIILILLGGAMLGLSRLKFRGPRA